MRGNSGGRLINSRIVGILKGDRRKIKICEPLNDLLQRGKKGNAPIEQSEACLRESKRALVNATMLAHPIPGAPVSLAVDTFDYALGAVLQQRVNDAWQPLGFLTKPLNSAQRKYTAVKRFRRAIEKRYFIIFTDHKPLHMRSIKTSISVRRDNSDTSITSDNSSPTYDT